MTNKLLNEKFYKYFPWLLSTSIFIIAISILYFTNELTLAIILIASTIIFFTINLKLRIIFLILLIPFAHAGIGIDKLAGLGIFDIYSFWFILLFMIRTLKIDYMPVKNNLIIYLFVIMIISFIPSLINSNSFFSSSKAFIHLLINFGMLYSLFYYLTNLNDAKYIHKILKIYAVVAIIVSIIGIYQASTSSPISGYLYGRTYFTLFGEVNYYATYLLFTIPIIIGLIITENIFIKKLFYLFGTLILSIAIISTVSRSAIFTLITMIIFFIIYIIWKGKLNKGLIILTTIISLSILVIILTTDIGKKFIDYFTLARRFETVLQGRDLSVLQRKDIFLVGTRMIEAHPIIGVGFGTFEENFDSYKQTDLSTGFSRSAHNTPLRIFAETGIIGFGGFLLFIIGLLTYNIKKIKSIEVQNIKILSWAILVSILTFLIMSMSLDLLFEPYFWISIGLLLANFELTKQKSIREKIL